MHFAPDHGHAVPSRLSLWTGTCPGGRGAWTAGRVACIVGRLICITERVACIAGRVIWITERVVCTRAGSSATPNRSSARCTGIPALGAERSAPPPEGLSAGPRGLHHRPCRLPSIRVVCTAVRPVCLSVRRAWIVGRVVCVPAGSSVLGSPSSVGPHLASAQVSERLLLRPISLLTCDPTSSQVRCGVRDNRFACERMRGACAGLASDCRGEAAPVLFPCPVKTRSEGLAALITEPVALS